MKLILIGDVMLGGKVNDRLEDRPASYPWGDTLELLRSADVCVCNLECVISDLGSPWSVTPQVFHFRSAAKNIAVLAEAGIDAVSLANNHVLDYGLEALLEMSLLLGRAGIRHAGAGRNRAEARELAVIESCGVRLGLFAFTDNRPDWEAGEHHPGVWHVPVDLDDARMYQLLDLVKAARDQIDFLVVSAHWGANWGASPPPKHRIVGKALLDAGADIVFGHSAHVFRGIELCRDGAIMYGAGDFVNDYLVHPLERNDQSCIWELDVAPDGLRKISLYPIVIRNFQARLARNLMAQEIVSRVSRLCSQLSTTTSYNADHGCLSIVIPQSRVKR
jgi:poly-gamma-glutamate synthesis protein (capsule biosynthesis protein)